MLAEVLRAPQSPLNSAVVGLVRSLPGGSEAGGYLRFTGGLLPRPERGRREGEQRGGGGRRGGQERSTVPEAGGS